MSIKIGKPVVVSDMQGPCPEGFHLPTNSERQAVYDIWTGLGGGGSDGTNFGIALRLPFAGYRDYYSSSVGSQGYYGVYWASSPFTGEDYSYYLYFRSSYVGPQYNSSRAYGFSLRCFKDSFIIPTSSWTKLYGTSIESGGIFWNSTDGLISLSSDGTNRITIADKNLGATTVWNSGDTLSESNCGKYYQWGNNYGFAWTGNVTTSSTKVNANSYGPGNYYSSSTFITVTSSPYRWDTGNNTNLRGGVSQGTTTKEVEPKNIYTYKEGVITDMRGPCPEGFHVPSIDEFISLVSMLTTLGLATCTNLKTYLKIPTAGELYFGNPTVNARQHIYLWSSSVSTTYRRVLTAFSTSDAISTNDNNAAGYAVPIRPFKDTVVVPDSTWTALYSDKIYHNATLGLISISSDGNTWITIADKNLGATNVYNSGDTLSESNCGKYYQRGNNYGFPFDGSATTSGTAIDASNYGPGNYYSSSTFITVSNWDSSNNTNLRGGVTGPMTEKSIKAVYTRKNEGGILTEHKIRPTYKREPTADTIAYYPLNGNANDYGGNNRNLTTNGVTYSETIANGNKCGTFTGTIRSNGSKGGEWTSGVSMSNANMTLSVRAKTTGNGTDSTYGANKWMLLYFQDSGRNYGQVIKTAHNTTGYRAVEWGAGGSGIVTSADTATPYADGQWHHFCATYTISSVKLFVDGQLVSSGTGSFTVVTTNYNIYVGKDTTSYNYYGYAGQMSEVIFEKATWTDADVLAYYNRTKSNYGL